MRTPQMRETKMKPADLMRYYTTQAEAGAAIGIGQGAVGNMMRRGRISHLAQLKWEAATGGALKADPKILGRRASQK